VILPRRIKADFVDGFISVTVCAVLLIVGEMLADKVSDFFLWVPVVA
jgi:hypothetical protein